MKKAKEYLDAGASRVLLIFKHGLGDFIMFRRAYVFLCVQYPQTEFFYGIEKGMGYEEFLDDNEKYVLIDRHQEKFNGFDRIFTIDFLANEEASRSKLETCFEKELGFPPPKDIHVGLRKVESRLVSVHFYSTCLPNCIGLIGNDDVARKIWMEIQEAGFIPIETHFIHKYSDPYNINFPFINANVRGAQTNANNLLSLIQNSHAFIGVISGNLHVALASLPENRIMILERDIERKKRCATNKDITSVNVNVYKSGTVYNWLKNL